MWRSSIVAAAVLLSSCTGLAASASERLDQTIVPYLVLPEDEKGRLIEGLKTVKLGDSWDDVKRILGEPDHDQRVAYKETGLFRWTVRKYDVYRVSDGANTNDEVATLVFDKQDRLIAISSTIREYIREEMSPDLQTR